jgi:tRNA (guanine-N7-)-methyltransferase
MNISHSRGKIAREQIRALEERLGACGSAELEIGAAKGGFLLQRAAENPDVLFVAVEIRRKLAGIMSARCEELSLRNVVVLNDDIRNVFARVFGGECLFDRVFIHFPDPWWKRRHGKRYLAGEDMIANVSRVLKRGGELFIQTDVFGRAGRVLAMLTENPGFENLSPEGGFIESSPFRHRTAREQTCHDLGLPVFRIHFRKSK